MGTSVTSSYTEICPRAFTAALITTIGLGILLPTSTDAFNRRSALATPAVAISPANETSALQPGLLGAVKGKPALRLVGSAALKPLGLATSNIAPLRKIDVVDRAPTPDVFELSGAWSTETRWADAPDSYASLVPSYIPPELRLLPVLESLSSSTPSAMADFALGYTLSALRQGPSADEPVVRLQVLLGGTRQSELQRIRPRPKSPAPEGTDSWKPVVGGRFFVDLARKWTLALRGDARGFRISGASDMSWNVVGSIGRNVGDLLEVRLGYRVSRVDSREHTGTFGLSELVQGPQLGIVLDF